MIEAFTRDHWGNGLALAAEGLCSEAAVGDGLHDWCNCMYVFHKSIIAAACISKIFVAVVLKLTTSWFL